MVLGGNSQNFLGKFVRFFVTLPVSTKDSRVKKAQLRKTANKFFNFGSSFLQNSRSGADAIKKFTPSLGIPKLGVRSKIWEPLVTPKPGLLNF